jgi:hypothetical protein
MTQNTIYSRGWARIAAITICLFATLATQAQELMGTITDEHKRPVYRAHLQLLRDGKLRNRVFTDTKGRYHIWPIEPGGYQALISLDGYDRVIQDIDIKKRDTVTIDFILRKKPGLLSK